MLTPKLVTAPPQFCLSMYIRIAITSDTHPTLQHMCDEKVAFIHAMINCMGESEAHTKVSPASKS